MMFDAYYAGREVAYALEITQVWEYANPVGLSTLRDRFQRFVPPFSLGGMSSLRNIDPSAG